MAGSENKSLFSLMMQGLFASRLGLLGAGITTIAGAMIAASFILEWLGVDLGPYQGLVSYMMLPGMFVGGLLMIPLGSWLAWRDAKKKGKGDAAPRPFVVDLGQPRQRKLWFTVAGLSAINLVLILTLSYKGYHYTESTVFCGKLCHTVMDPEYTAYQRSPHARVACVECHIGPGASWFVRSKLSGLRQVYGVIADDFHKPIPTPIDNLRPARDTCEQCHWPEVFHGNRPKVFESAADDENPLDSVVSAVMLHVGGRDIKTGRYHGIHWHVSRDNRVEYLSSDRERIQIKEIRVTAKDGSTRLFVKEDVPAVPAGTEWRTMDCIDCHNRPTHIYETPEGAVDRLILNGRLPAGLPALRAASMEAVSAKYASREEAGKGIPAAMLAWYKKERPEAAAAMADTIQKAGDTLFLEAYSANVYPSLKLEWNTYKSHLGHQGGAGCFRCHDEEHKTKDGAAVSQDCDNCHNIMADKVRRSQMDERLRSYLFLEQKQAAGEAR